MKNDDYLEFPKEAECAARERAESAEKALYEDAAKRIELTEQVELLQAWKRGAKAREKDLKDKLEVSEVRAAALREAVWETILHARMKETARSSLRKVYNDTTSGATLIAERDQLRVEVAKMQKVVEAAREWNSTMRYGQFKAHVRQAMADLHNAIIDFGAADLKANEEEGT